MFISQSPRREKRKTIMRMCRTSLDVFVDEEVLVCATAMSNVLSNVLFNVLFYVLSYVLSFVPYYNVQLSYVLSYVLSFVPYYNVLSNIPSYVLSFLQSLRFRTVEHGLNQKHYSVISCPCCISC